MGSRNKPKPNTIPAPAEAEADDSKPHAAPTATPSRDSLVPSLAPSEDSSAPGTQTPTTKGSRTGRKWLGSGNWRSKAPALAKGSTESIGVSVAGGAPSELPAQDDGGESRPESPAARFLTKRKSSKGDAIPAAMTKLSVSSSGATDESQIPPPASPTEKPSSIASTTPAQEPPLPPANEPPLPPDPPQQQKTPATSIYGWRSWWSRPDGYSESAQAKDTETAQTTPLPGPTPSEEPDTQLSGPENGTGETQTQPQPQPRQDANSGDVSQTIAGETEPKDAPPQTANAGARTSWFWLWSSTQNAKAAPAAPKEPDLQEVQTPDSVPAPAPAPQPDQGPPPEQAATEPTAPRDGKPSVPQTSKPQGWAFWFTGSGKTESATAGGPQKQVGEVAVYDTPSQSHPEAAQFNEQEQSTEELPKESAKQAVEDAADKRSFKALRGRPKTKQSPIDTPVQTSASSKIAASSKKVSPVRLPDEPNLAPAPQPVLKPTDLKESTKAKQHPPNLILPEFNKTYQLVQKPTYWQKVRQYFLGSESAMSHLYIDPAPPRIRKAVAIGVHGFFPGPLVQRVLGQPTGTSIRFATAARKAIDDWTKVRGYVADVEQIALEGEGTISERVNTLWKLLLNWIDHVKTADFILVACHSQGVPVAIMLVAKLIQFGCVDAARIGVCAMAGVNMGPFIEYKTKYLGPTAAELFEFSKPKSLVSQMYLAALDEVLRHGVRILYVGSIDDQLVSLESSTFSTISHRYIYRAVFVDGRLHAPDFITHLVGFALKLRNLGIPDHGLIRELSPALAGSLYGGEGHSRLYDDQRMYDLAVQHALETTSLPMTPQPSQGRPATSSSLKGIKIPIPGAQRDEKDPYALQVKDYEATGGGSHNPFFLPWAMRGLLEEGFVKKELSQEVEELLNLFEEWQPQNKQLKDVKFRLEAVRSRL